MILLKFAVHSGISFVLWTSLLLLSTVSFQSLTSLARIHDVPGVDQNDVWDLSRTAPARLKRDSDDPDDGSSDESDSDGSTINGMKPSLSVAQAATTKVPNSEATSLLSSGKVHYDARDITYFLESHPAHSVVDPRVYFTEERTSRSLGIMLNEMNRIPRKLRLAYMVRVFNELGRKIATKLDYYSVEVSAILRKTPDDLGNKPEVSMLVDAVDKVFESKSDFDPNKDSDEETMRDDPISHLIMNDSEKNDVFESSIAETGKKFADLLSYFAVSALKFSEMNISTENREPMATILGEALKMGAKTMITEISTNDKFRVPQEIVDCADKMLNISLNIFQQKVKDGDDNVSDSIRRTYNSTAFESFKDLNPISDKTGLMGTWNNYLLSGLGSAERVLKVFASLLSRVPNQAKSRWLNMYIAQVNQELERTLSGFVVMQGMPYNRNSSEVFLLNPTKTVTIVPNKMPELRSDYAADKNRMPARCYLAGRRWRLLLVRACRGYDSRDTLIKSVADKISELKSKTFDKSGNEIYRLCMPRLEVGLRGWGINGDPGSASDQTEKLSMRNPIENLLLMDDPFESGVKLGYNIGVKVGYNEERNATLEMENAAHTPGDIVNNAATEIKYLAMASYRKAAAAGAKKAFEIAVREGYMATLKLSIRAGMKIPAEAGSKMAMLKSVSFAGQVGTDAGRSVIGAYLVEKKNVKDSMRESLVKVGRNYGLLAGETMGKAIGALVGKTAAEEAYRHAIIRGGKVSRAKFHLEEYEAGAKLGFEQGVKEGKRVAASSKIDPSAPRFFRFPSAEEGDKSEVDHWEKDIIPPLSREAIESIHVSRNHTMVSGSLKGKYKIAKEVKRGMRRISYTNETYTLEVFANGFIRNNIAYLTLNGTVDKMGVLRGSLIARDIFNENID